MNQKDLRKYSPSPSSAEIQVFFLATSLAVYKSHKTFDSCGTAGLLASMLGHQEMVLELIHLYASLVAGDFGVRF